MTNTQNHLNPQNKTNASQKPAQRLTTHNSQLTTAGAAGPGSAGIQIQGALLPAELLQRIVNTDSELEGLKPTDYHLSPSERLNEAATRAWTRLLGVWQTFKNIAANLPEEAIGTTETRERWLLPLFQELGYGRPQVQSAIEIDGKSYRISHKVAEPIALHLISFRYDLDKRNPGAKVSPHSLVQEFINRSPNHLWGFLSNGYKLRLLRDNLSLTRAAYIEFDLQAMLDNNIYNDFFLLYLLCHQSRVEAEKDENGRELPPETCWLEKWYNTSIKEGVRALDDLRNSVQAAIEALGAGFITHPANTTLKDKLRNGTLNKQDYYHQVLMLVYRLLFIFVAEDRDLLIPEAVPENVKQTYNKYYATHRIRELAYKQRGSSHTDLWQQIEILFKGLSEGNQTLGLPALGSFLFRSSSTPDLANCRIANSDLLLAFRHLCYTQKQKVFQLINYRNLGHEELGSVYESLLEMHPEINLDEGYFALDVVSGSDRKTTGSYYTPSSLVNHLLDTALEPVISNAISTLTDPKDREAAILNLKICDPACGSGHFLISAAHRLAKRLAAIRSGESEPAPSIINGALRDVIGNCIYGVDLNPMAVELCKISLWMESLEPGKPLTFLDHHIQCGNSLLGCTPELLKEGIPDAAYTPLTGDDWGDCLFYKERNRKEYAGETNLFSYTYRRVIRERDLQAKISAFNDLSDNNLQQLRAKETSYQELIHSETYQNKKLVYDAWCAAFVCIKNSSLKDIPTPVYYPMIEILNLEPESLDEPYKQEIRRLAEQYRFFHWHIAFQDVFPDLDDKPAANYGFDCILGNPPWEKVKLQEKEFFATRDEKIASAPNAAIRKKLISGIRKSNPSLYQAFLAEKRKSEGTSLLIRESGNFPLCGKGDLNTYTVFAELNRKLLADHGRCGFIVPSGIATDDSTKEFFQDIMNTDSLISLYDFENKKPHFPEVDSRYRFCLMTLRAPDKSDYFAIRSGYAPADFVFFAHDIDDLKDHERHFQLSAVEIGLINPNTRTCPIFRSKQDAELTKYIYYRLSILIDDNDPLLGNPWDISFMRMFDMANDSNLFQTKHELEEEGFELEGNHLVKGEQHYLPLYEAKMMHQFNHRFGDFSDLPPDSKSTKLPDIPLAKLQNPDYEPLPRYWIERFWVSCKTYHDKEYGIGFRDITNTTNERTVICTAFPWSAVGHNLSILLTDKRATEAGLLIACLNSFACDFIARFKVGGIHLSFYIFKQLAVLPPEVFTDPDLEPLVKSMNEAILELIYTSHSMQPFAKECGYDGPPFIWDEERRFELRCRLDAIFFHLYLGSLSEWQTEASPALLSYLPTPRHAIEYIMSTFPIVKRKDEKEFGEYRTLRRILEIYDALPAARC